MGRDDRLSGTEILALAALGVGAGLAGRLCAWRVDRRSQPARGCVAQPGGSVRARPCASPLPRRSARSRPPFAPSAARRPRYRGGVVLPGRRGAARLGADPYRAGRGRRSGAGRAGHRQRHQQHPGSRRRRPGLAESAAPHRPERMTEPLAPQYNPSAIESALYAWWEERGLFSPDATAPSADAAPYVIMMPPPNVTAALHMGHGLNNTVQDVLVRFERMRGREALWLPGTDHAGIATQNVVERLLAAEGQTRFDLGREAFVERVWALRPRDGRRHPRAASRPRLLGATGRARTSRSTRALERAVREAFVRLLRRRARLPRPLHHQLVPALPHRALQRGGREGGGRRPALAPPLSARRRRRPRHGRHHAPRDDAGRHRRRRAPGRRALPPAGRPELRAPAGRPADSRRRRRRGRSGVRQRRGQGDARRTIPTDFEIGRRHGLPSIDIMTPEARISRPRPERFQGLDRFEARKRGRRRVRGRRPAGEGRAAPARRGPLLPLPHRGRAAALGPVVRADGAARRARRSRPTATARSQFIPERRGDDYAALAGGHPRLVHLPPALVGPPHSGVVLPGRGMRARPASAATTCDAVPGCGGDGAPGRRRARHLVLLLARALLQPRLARADART